MARPSQGLSDIVATQGAYLITPPRTPIFEKPYHETFLAKLDRAFQLHDFGQRLRRSKYHEAADEWLFGYTPPEVRERYLAEMRAIEDLWDKTTDESSDGNGDEGDDAIANGKARVEKTRPATQRASRTLSKEAHGLPTPSLTGHSSSPTKQGRKRRLDGEEEEEEEEEQEEKEEDARKTRVISTATLDVPGGEKLDGF